MFNLSQIKSDDLSDLYSLPKSIHSDQIDQSINKVQLAYETLKEKIMFHGTSKIFAEDILQNGFQLKRKKSGATSILSSKFGIDDPKSSKHHYLMGLKSAIRYAKMFDNSTIVYVVIPPSLKLIKDPEGHSSDEYMTNQDIPKDFILTINDDKPSKNKLSNVCKEFDLFLTNTELNNLVEKIYKFIILKNKKKIDKFMKQEIDFKTAESLRNEATMSLLLKSGINFDDLKEGQTFSLPLD